MTKVKRNYKILIVGGISSDHPDEEKLQQIAFELGKNLGKSKENQIMVCSAHHSAIDRGAILGFLSSNRAKKNPPIICYPNDLRPDIPLDKRIKAQWTTLLCDKNIKLKRVGEELSYSKVRTNSDLSMGFLLCQLHHLERADLAIILGGHNDGSLAAFVKIARNKSPLFPIIPLPFYGGIGESEFDKYFGRKSLDHTEHELQRVEQFKLRNRESLEKIESAVKYFFKLYSKKKIFMSYSWERKEEADFVEAFIRRHKEVDLFRDEVEIKTGKPITSSILAEIDNCDIFLMLWCNEYASSPYCYDEFHYIAEKKLLDKIHIIFLDNTRAVWPILRESGGFTWSKKWDIPKKKVTRKTIEESLKDLISKLPTA